MLIDLRPYVGGRIRFARQQQGLTQSDLARKLGVTSQAVQLYERGEKLSLDRVMTIAVTLRVAPDWLLTGAEARQRPRRRRHG